MLRGIFIGPSGLLERRLRAVYNTPQNYDVQKPAVTVQSYGFEKLSPDYSGSAVSYRLATAKAVGTNLRLFLFRNIKGTRQNFLDNSRLLSIRKGDR